ncbi:histidine kinase [Psychrobium sp. MM17-31]|uniref:sensor histidine kinase n=1 Tax=Psychrobium sp. MM17-31 TaxID=2917758 RepID=UPI001EF3DB96|nr:histidine kinase [Psychrobium sp. MM17-31]MCG7532891.1 histidine kinase [Psychrobium sp. MM17-31]
MNKQAFYDWWREYRAIAFSSTKSYKIVTVVGLTLNLFMSVSILQAMITHNGQYSAIVLRAVVDGLWFFLITHFFIRSYLKIKITHSALSGAKVWRFLAFLIPVSVIHIAGAVGVGQFEYFAFTDVNSLKLFNDQGETEFDIQKLPFIALLIFNTYIVFLAWAIVYTFWHQQINRRKVQKEMHQAQIQQLTNQLNPHFLFNAFNSIRALIYEDKDKAADTVTQLSELFRTHLQAHLKAKSTLEDEWNVCSRYLAIEGIRLEERLQLGVTLDDELLGQQIPTLTLLTLIENAIKHGISPNSEPGKIMVSANKISDKKWHLSVGNTIDKPSQADGTNTGMKNVKQRLSLMFGKKYQWVQTKTDSFFEVKMELPLA